MGEQPTYTAQIASATRVRLHRVTDTYSSFYELGLLDSDLEAVRPRKRPKRKS